MSAVYAPVERERNGQAEFEIAINQLQAQAAHLGAHLSLDVGLLQSYARQVASMAAELRQQVRLGPLTWGSAAAHANEMRNVIMDSVRGRSSPYGRAAAEVLKAQGKTFNALIARKTLQLYGPQAVFERLRAAQKDAVYAPLQPIRCQRIRSSKVIMSEPMQTAEDVEWAGTVLVGAGSASVVRIPIPGTHGLCLQLDAPGGYKGSTSTLFFVEDPTKKAGRMLRLDHGPRPMTVNGQKVTVIGCETMVSDVALPAVTIRLQKVKADQKVPVGGVACELFWQIHPEPVDQGVDRRVIDCLSGALCAFGAFALVSDTPEVGEGFVGRIKSWLRTSRPRFVQQDGCSYRRLHLPKVRARSLCLLETTQTDVARRFFLIQGGTTPLAKWAICAMHPSVPWSFRILRFKSWFSMAAGRQCIALCMSRARRPSVFPGMTARG